MSILSNKKCNYVGILCVLLTVMFFYTNSYAESKDNKFMKYDRNYWFLLGYNQNLIEERSDDMGPLYGTFGLDILDFLSFDLTLAGVMANKVEYVQRLITESGVLKGSNSSNQNLMSFDIKPYLVFQYKFPLGIAVLRPYVGLGPTFHYVVVSSTGNVQDLNLDSNSFDFGVSTKFGLRFQFVKYFMLGVNMEYLYHKSDAHFANNNSTDLSGFMFGLELGGSF